MQGCFHEPNGKDTPFIDRKKRNKILHVQWENLKSEVTFTFSYHGTRYPNAKNGTSFI